MSRAYSADLRERVIDAVAAGASARGAAVRFGIGAATAVRWVRRWRETGERGARRQGCPKRSILDPHEDFLLGLVTKEVDVTIDEMRARLQDERCVRAARVTIWRFFERRGYAFKKRPAMPASRPATRLPRRGATGSNRSPTSIQSA
jgi:transposase